MVAGRCGIDSGRGNAGLSSGKLGVGAREDEEALGARNRRTAAGVGRGAGDGGGFARLERKEEEENGNMAAQDKVGGLRRG